MGGHQAESLTLYLRARFCHEILEPDRAGSRYRCRCVQPCAWPCKAGALSTRYFSPLGRLPKLRVAGSNPVSRSSIPVRPRPLRPGAFSFRVFGKLVGVVPRGCGGVRSRAEFTPPDSYVSVRSRASQGLHTLHVATLRYVSIRLGMGCGPKSGPGSAVMRCVPIDSRERRSIRPRPRSAESACSTTGG